MKKENRLIPKGMKSAQVILVIKTTSAWGEGTEKDPVRVVTQYWDLGGELLAELDPCKFESVLSSVTTKDLINELCKRTGVKKKIAEPYEEIEFHEKGPAIVLIVSD